MATCQVQRPSSITQAAGLKFWKNGVWPVFLLGFSCCFPWEHPCFGTNICRTAHNSRWKGDHERREDHTRWAAGCCIREGFFDGTRWNILQPKLLSTSDTILSTFNGVMNSLCILDQISGIFQYISAMLKMQRGDFPGKNVKDHLQHRHSCGRVGFGSSPVPRLSVNRNRLAKPTVDQQLRSGWRRWFQVAFQWIW